MAKYSMEPVDVPPVATKFRQIRTALPVPESLPIFESLAGSEPRSMMGMPPVVWDRAEGFIVHDCWGNRWLDWSSGVLVTNAGHGHPKIKAVLAEEIQRSLLTSYVFVHNKRSQLTRALQALAPDPERYKVFLLTTGAEATECCIKLAKTYACRRCSPDKRYIISFEGAFHGRTMGAQLAGGMGGQKEWIGELDPSFVQVPFPDGFYNSDVSFDLFVKTLAQKGIRPDEIAGIMTESYQGVGPNFLPMDYAKRLEAFCREHDIVLIFDEVQAGFGRTGEMFCFEHYDVKPDLIACGKGITSSMPLSAVIGRTELMDLYPPGSMTSTHSASPLCVAAALVNLAVIQEEGLVENARVLGEILIQGLERIQTRHPNRLGMVIGRGLVAGMLVVESGTRKPDPETALAINLACFHKGLLMFAPVGIGGECVKIAPPLCITEEALLEGIAVLEEAVEQVLA
jgi:4-aminobutyrate aminotransferase-like enzyme